MSATKHRRWTTVLDNSAADRAAGRDMTGWVGVSDATDEEFKAGKVHGRTVDADEHCTPDCPAPHGNTSAGLGSSPVWDDLDMRARYLTDQGWSAEDIAAVLGTSLP